MEPQHRVQLGERLFWTVAAALALIFVAYFIGAYRFSAPARRHMRQQAFGKGVF